MSGAIPVSSRPQNGGGFLTDLFPEPRKAIWDCKGIYATSRHIPKVRFAAITHPGLIGCAPSHELLAQWNKREAELIASNPDRVPPLALPPTPEGVLLGSLKGAALEKAGKEAARTIPPREHGGNCDIKNISRGSRIYFPVYVKGAKLSMGDYHFSQGDGEITFCGAIEMAGWIHLHVDIIKGGVTKYGLTNPLFKISPVDPHYGDFLVFEGIGVDDKTGKQLYNDATMAMRRACLNAIEYLSKFGYSKEQAYVILGCAPVEGRIGGVVDIPNACVSVAIPTDMFEFDIHPTLPVRKSMSTPQRSTWRVPDSNLGREEAGSPRLPSVRRMPLYTYECRRHGSFSDWRAMSECHSPAPCPICQVPADRTVSAPHRGMDATLRTSHQINEKSANEPRTVRRRRGDPIPAHDTHRDLTRDAHRSGSHGHSHGSHAHANEGSSTLRSNHPWMVRH